MKTYPKPVRRRARHARVPVFAPVPLRGRADGWTPARQAAFLAALAITRSVKEAARRVGMARETAYRLRRRRDAASFAAAWDMVLGREAVPRPKVTHAGRKARALFGLLKPVIYAGRHVATTEKADNSALLGVISEITRSERTETRAGERSHGFGRASRSTSP